MSTQADLETAKCALADAQAALTASQGASSYSIDGIAVTRQTMGELQAQVNRLHRRVLQITAALGGALAPSIRVARIYDPTA